MPIQTFIHNSALYTQIHPAKRLFNSTLIHEVVTRGDIFALNLSTGQFTVLPRHVLDTQCKQYELRETSESKQLTLDLKQRAAKAKSRLVELLEEMRKELE